MLGERGGNTASLDEAQELQEAHKALWSQTIREAILESLDIEGQFHADDLLTLGIPADCKNIVGAQVNALVRQRVMAETGERRSTSDPAGHGRRSAVYRITDLGRTKLRPHQIKGESLGGPETGSRGGGSAGEANVPLPKPIPAAATSGTGADTRGGDGPSPAVTALPTLFAADDFEFIKPVGGHYGSEVE